MSYTVSFFLTDIKELRNVISGKDLSILEALDIDEEERNYVQTLLMGTEQEQNCGSEYGYALEKIVEHLFGESEAVPEFEDLRFGEFDDPPLDWIIQSSSPVKLPPNEVPLITMDGHTLEQANTAFDRINSKGLKPNKNDIQSAYIAAEHTGLIASKVSPFIRKIWNDGFNRINRGLLFEVCRFIVNSDGRNKTPLHKFPKELVEEAWDRTAKATCRTVEFIKQEFGLVNMNLGWSHNLLIPAIALFDRWETEKTEPEINGLSAWIALASVHHRYTTSAVGHIAKDLNACKQNDPIGALLKNLRNTSKTDALIAMPKHFQGQIQDKGALFAAYIACRYKEMRDFISKEKIVKYEDIDKHHIMPRKYADNPLDAKRFDTIANFAFIKSKTNRGDIGDDSPNIYIPKVSIEVRNSQCVPMLDEYSIDDAEIFWQQRSVLLSEAFNEYVRTKLPNRKLS